MALPPVTLPPSSKVIVPKVFGGVPRPSAPPVPDGTSAGSPVPLSTRISGSIGTSTASSSPRRLPAGSTSAGAAGAAATVLSVGAPASVFLPSSSWNRNSLSSCIFRICSCICRIWKLSSSMVPESARTCSSSAVMRGSPACAICTVSDGFSLPPKSFGRPILASPLSAVVSTGFRTSKIPARSSAWTTAPDSRRIASVPLRTDLKYMGIPKEGQRSARTAPLDF